MSQPAIEPDEPLGAENEAQWDRLRSQIELASGFWLGFVFSPSARTAGVLRERVERALKVERRTLLLIQPATPEELRGVLQRLVEDDAPAEAGCTWVEAVRADSAGAKEQPWTAAWDELFLRMNVRRDVLRRRLSGGLVFAATPEIKARVREAAPDLWAVRDLVIDLAPVRSRAETAEFALPSLEMGEGPAPDPEFALQEAARRGALGAKRSQALALMEAAEGLLAQDKAREARDVALEAWGLLQGDGDFEEAKALVMLARAEHQDHDAAATDHILRGIALARRVDIRSVPQSWHLWGATVAFNTHDYMTAKEISRESVAIARSRLTEKETARRLASLALALSQLAAIESGTGESESALVHVEESILVARRFLRLTKPEARFRAVLQVALQIAAVVHRARGDDAAALAAEEEAAALDAQPA